MRAAIVGLPYSGKSTLFSAVTSLIVDPGEMPQERLGTVAVPDPRLDHLAKLYQPKKYTPATVEFLDVPGFNLADAHGQDEFRKHIPAIRQCDVLVLVVRDFQSPAVVAYRDRVDAQADLAELREELLFADLDTVTRRIEKLQSSLKKPSKMHEQEKRELAILEACRGALEDGRPLSSAVGSDDDRRQLASFAFLTERPSVVVFNVDEDRAAAPEAEKPDDVHSAIALCAEIEAQIAALEPADRQLFLEDLGIQETARDRLIRNCFDAMDYIAFLTAGPDEVRAWPIRKGTAAVDAAGKIHSDLARGFIRAETVAYNDLVACEDMKGARAAGKVRQEGKTYVVADGDVVNIKFNV